MADLPACARCSAPLPGGRWGKLCPRCISRVSLGGGGHSETGTTPPPSTPASVLPGAPRKRIGEYELIEKLGEGGSAVVWRARQRRLGRMVALKLLREPEKHEAGARARLRREAAAVGALQHPGIVAIHDVGEEEGQAWIAMALIEGTTLARLLRDQPLSPQCAAALLHAISAAVGYAHKRGIVHRDLKPANILIDLDGLPRVADFGLAKVLVETGTQPRRGPETVSGHFFGTPQYAPPEQIAMHGERGNPAGDVYSLGVVLYEMLTGRPPYLAASLEATFLQVLEAQPIPPRRYAPSVPRDLQTICLKCLEKDPSRRYATAVELHEELNRYVAGEPIRACPPGPVDLAWRWTRRRPALATALAGCLAALVLGMTLTTWQWRLAETYASRLATSVLELRMARVSSLLQENEATAAAAWLGMMLREGTRHPVVPQRLASILARHAFQLPALPPLPHPEVRIGGFSPDGRRAISTGAKSVRLWDTSTGVLLGEFPHLAPSRPVFSRDGKLLATLASDRGIQLWDTETCQRVGALLVHEGPLRASSLGSRRPGDASRSPWAPAYHVWLAHFVDNRLMAVHGADGILHLWDVELGRRIRAEAIPDAEFSLDGQTLVNFRDSTFECRDGRSWETIASIRLSALPRGARLSSDGRRLATLSSGGRLQVWEVRSGSQVSDLGDLDEPLWALVFAPGGNRLAAQGRSGLIRLFDVDSSKPAATIPSSARPIEERSFSPDGTRLVVANRDQVQVWNLPDGKLAVEPALHEARVIMAVFGPDASRILATAVGGSVGIWRLAIASDLRSTLPHSGTITSLGIDSTGTLVATTSKDSTARIWSLRDGAPVSPPLAHGTQVDCARFSPDGQNLATGASDGVARIWDCRSGGLVRPPLDHGAPLRSIEWDPRGGRLLTIATRGTAMLWDVATGVRAVNITHADPGVPFGSQTLSSAAFDPAGERLVTTGADGVARIWLLKGALGTPMVSVRHRIGIQSAIFSPDGDFLATAGLDWEARVWNARTGTPVSPPLRHGMDLVQVRFSRDGTGLLTACQDGIARLWDHRTGVLRIRPMRHRNKVYDALFSPDERFVLTISEDDTVRLWDASTGFEVCGPFPQGSTMAAPRFSPDGRTIVVAAPGNRAHLWDISYLVDLVPIPWLVDFSEAVTRRRLTSEESLEPVPLQSMEALGNRFLRENPGRDLPRWVGRYMTPATPDPGGSEPRPVRP